MDYNDRYILIEEENKKMELNEYLETLIGKTLFKEDQKELIDMIGLKDKQGRKQKSISLLNSYLIENYKMTLNTSRVKNEEGKKKTIWILSRI